MVQRLFVNHQKRLGMVHVLKESHSFISTPTRVQSAISMSHIPAFAFPAIAGTHLPTPEGWKAELAWMAGQTMHSVNRSRVGIRVIKKFGLAGGVVDRVKYSYNTD